MPRTPGSARAAIATAAVARGVAQPLCAERGVVLFVDDHQARRGIGPSTASRVPSTMPASPSLPPAREVRATLQPAMPHGDRASGTRRGSALPVAGQVISGTTQRCAPRSRTRAMSCRRPRSSAAFHTAAESAKRSERAAIFCTASACARRWPMRGTKRVPEARSDGRADFFRQRRSGRPRG